MRSMTEGVMMVKESNKNSFAQKIVILLLFSNLIFSYLTMDAAKEFVQKAEYAESAAVAA